MTIPSERTRAVELTEKFLYELAWKQKGVPKPIRETAAALLRHYPTKFDLDIVVSEWKSEIYPCPFGVPYRDQLADNEDTIDFLL